MKYLLRKPAICNTHWLFIASSGDVISPYNSLAGTPEHGALAKITNTILLVRFLVWTSDFAKRIVRAWLWTERLYSVFCTYMTVRWREKECTYVGVVINQRKHSTGVPNQATVQNVNTTYVVHHTRNSTLLILLNINILRALHRCQHTKPPN